MGFDLSELNARVAQHGRVVRIVIAAVRGSSPREVGTAMLVWNTGQSGTIGGGALEFEAATTARDLQVDHLSNHALGPDLGQCCGGAVTLLSEIYDAQRLGELQGSVIARPAATSRPMPMSVKRQLAMARGQGIRPDARLCDGWMVEPVHQRERPVWIWGAGHVGRALVDVLAPLPEFDITWVDTAQERFPENMTQGVTRLPAREPGRMVRHAPAEAVHLILTYSHALDLEVCHQLLGHGFHDVGLIGSATKWARFKSRLGQLGHSQEQIARITCPIGDPGLGKHPHAIAVGVVAHMLRDAASEFSQRDKQA